MLKAEKGSFRWLTIGTVKLDHYVTMANCGFPRGLRLNWVHRADWCQPWQFLNWEDLQGAVRRRLNLAGLELVAMASRVQRRYGEIVLRVLVVRWRRRKLRKRAHLNLPLAMPVPMPIVKEAP